MQFRDALRSIVLSNFSSEIRGSAYEKDEGSFVVTWLEDVKNKKKSQEGMPVTIAPIETTASDNYLTNAGKKMLFRVGLKMITNLKKFCCKRCYSQCVTKNPPHTTSSKFAPITRKGSTVFLQLPLCDYFVVLKKLFDEHIETFKKSNVNIEQEMLLLLSKVPLNIPQCHDIKSKLLKTFINRSIKCTQLKRVKKRRFNSGSMYKC